MSVLSPTYYQHPDVLFLSRDLLGKMLLTNIGGELTGGLIIETEAYRGPEDKASHAFGGRRTPRNEAMYAAGGISYVYRCYGIHNLFNIVTNLADIPHAVLIRAIKPTIGLYAMQKRRGKSAGDKKLTSGPGTLTQALGIELKHNALPLNGNVIWVEDVGLKIPDKEIVASPRIGVDYAGEDALLPWRFQARLKDEKSGHGHGHGHDRSKALS